MSAFGTDNSTPDKKFRRCMECRKAPENRVEIKHIKQRVKHKLSLSVRILLVVLFAGGFCLSTMNGAFAFFQTGQSLSDVYGLFIACSVAFVLTGATGLTAYFGIIQKKRGLLAMFVLVQGINLIINYTGVQQRLYSVKQEINKVQLVEDTKLMNTLRAGYQKTLDSHPATDKMGEPVSYKKIVSEMLIDTEREIHSINKVMYKEKRDTATRVPLTRIEYIVLFAWIFIPELLMLSAILARR